MHATISVLLKDCLYEGTRICYPLADGGMGERLFKGTSVVTDVDDACDFADENNFDIVFDDTLSSAMDCDDQDRLCYEGDCGTQS